MHPDALLAESGGVAGNLTAGLDYLTRSDPPRIPQTAAAFAAAARRVFRIAGIGRDDKFGAALERNAAQPPDNFALPTVGLLTGLHAFASPLAFVLEGRSGRVTVDVGVWTARSDLSPGQLDERGDVLAAVLRSLYPVISLSPIASTYVPLPETSLVLGIPSLLPPTASDLVFPIDRVIRSLSSEHYRVIVLAQPLTARRIEDLRDEVISEMRWVQAAAHAESLPSPLATDYLDMLKRQLATMAAAGSTGAWRTAVYLCGDTAALPRLESVWRSTFSGAKSLPEPVTVHRTAAATGWAGRWALPEVVGTPGTTHLSRPFELQTVLTSEQLASYIHLPEQEVPGFAVDAAARFDSVVAARSSDADDISLGYVVHAERVTSQEMSMPLSALTKHVLVAGVTGSGKSTTIRHLLVELARRKVPFLVVEPAKAEYRALAGLPELSGRLRVFTVGDESVGPLRLNPLAASRGSSVAMHVDLLKSLFSASFGLWAPLPQILERCLHRLYADYGWDLATNRNSRLNDLADWDAAFPTLTELHEEVEQYIGELGYQGEVTANMRAALSTRILGLTVGGKGAALDTRRSTPNDQLLDGPAVLELEHLADPDDQAFVIGLLMIRLAEHRRASGPSATLRHLLVIEEAHRLLARSDAADTANPRAKAVETFANMLAEIRSYGQGVLVADQVPVKLAPEVIKNTNLKITHRLVADDDRSALAAAMVMHERQHRALATLPPGSAAVFAEGQDGPVLLSMAALSPLAPISDHELRTAVPRDTSCDDGCSTRTATLTALPQHLDQALARVAQSALADDEAVRRLLPDLELAVRMSAAVAEHSTPCVLRRLADIWSSRRGRQYGWSFADTASIGSALATALTTDESTAVKAFTAAVVQSSRRRRSPFPRCDTICPDGTCLHRHAVRAILNAREGEAEVIGLASSTIVDDAWRRSAELSTRAVEFPSTAMDEQTWAAVQRQAVRASLCLVQQALVGMESISPRLRLDLLDRVVRTAPPEIQVDQ